MALKKIRRALLFVHYFVGIGALFGGGGAILDPSGETLGIAANETLKYAPFDDFLIPGLFLFGVLGLGNMIGALICHFKKDYWVYVSGGLGGILSMWIIIQCYMLRAIYMLHIIFFVIGIIQGVLALAILYRQQRFPFNRLYKYIE